MIGQKLKKLLLNDIWVSLIVGLRSCFKKKVTLERDAILASRGCYFLQISSQKCIACRLCEGVCPCPGALKIDSPVKHTFNQNKCAYCKLCQRVCPRGAIFMDIDPKN